MNKKVRRIFLFFTVGLLIVLTGCSKRFCNDEDKANIRQMYISKTIIYLVDEALEFGENAINDPTSASTVKDYITTDSDFHDFVKGTNEDVKLEISHAILVSEFKNNSAEYKEKLENDFYIALYSVEGSDSITPLIAGDNLIFKKVYEAAIEVYDKEFDTWACMTINGDTTESKSDAQLTPKDWGYAFKLGPLEGLFVFPISALLILITNIIGSTGLGQIFAIILATVLIRLLVLAFTFKSTMQSQKMQIVQPEIQQLQAKYHGLNDQASKQRMSQEMMKIYQKHGVNPISSLIAPFLTMPIFVAMYHAVSQTAILQSGSIFGITLGTILSEAITTNWNWFAITLFILMVITQFFAMKLPQLLQKKRDKKSKRFVDPRVKKTQNSTNMITYVFLVMIVIMGWMMPVAMTIYWIASSIVSAAQALIINEIMKKQKSNKGGKA